MGNKLYVGNLNFAVNDSALQELFTQAGNVVSAKVIVENQTGRSKGFGFVEMASAEEAQEAIKKFDGYEFEGRKLKVAEARPKENRPRGGGFGGGGRHGGSRGSDGGRRGW